MPSTDQLEHEVEHVRSQLVDALDEFRANLSPGQVLDQLTEYAGEGDAGEFYRRLRHQMGQNPVPMVLVGTGVAWMMLSSVLGSSTRTETSRRQSAMGDELAERAGSAADTVKEAGSATVDIAGRMGEAASESARSAGNAIREGAERASDRLGAAAGAAGDAVSKASSSAYDVVAGTTSRTASAVGESARHLGSSATSGARSFIDFCRSEPLVLASMGVAIGAVLGALMPATQTEDYLMGDQSDRLKENLGEMAETGERAKGDKPAGAESGGARAARGSKTETKRAAAMEAGSHRTSGTRKKRSQADT